MKFVMMVWMLFLLLYVGQASTVNHKDISNKKGSIYIVEIKNDIGPKVWRETKRSFDDAHRKNVDAIIIEMNTYGGMVIYADSLRTLILNEKIPVWVFINNNAASAGALISIACDKIYMVEGGNIGAATVVNQTGEAMPDKYQSYMRSMIRSTAQAHGKDTIIEDGQTLIKWKRDPRIAEAMVDERIAIAGVTDSGQIITFTSHEAMKYGFCDGIVTTIQDIAQSEQFTIENEYHYHTTFIDTIIGFLINPIVQGILIMIIIGGIYFELQTPGIGFPLAASMIACLLYFMPLLLEGIADYWEIILFIVGVILLLVEIFAIPGFGVTGILGIVCIVSSLIFAQIDIISFTYLDDFVWMILKATAIVLGSSTLGLIIGIMVGRLIITSPVLPFALHSEQRVEDGYISVDYTLRNKIGAVGVTATDLRPSGKVRIDDELYDAVATQGEYIQAGKPVKVIQFQSGQLYVQLVG